MTDFSTSAELSLTVPQRELRSVRDEIESGIGDVAVSVEGQQARSGGQARTDGGGLTANTLAGGATVEELGDQTEILEDILDELEQGGLGGGGGGGVGGSLLQTVGLSSLVGGGGIGAGSLIGGTISASALVSGSIVATSLVAGTIGARELIEIGSGGEGIEVVRERGEEFADENPDIANIIRDGFRNNPIFDFGQEVGKLTNDTEDTQDPRNGQFNLEMRAETSGGTLANQLLPLVTGKTTETTHTLNVDVETPTDVSQMDMRMPDQTSFDRGPAQLAGMDLPGLATAALGGRSGVQRLQDPVSRARAAKQRQDQLRALSSRGVPDRAQTESKSGSRTNKAAENRQSQGVEATVQNDIQATIDVSTLRELQELSRNPERYLKRKLGIDKGAR